MEPMVGLDAKFLYSETPTAHMHTLKVVVLPAGVTFEVVERELAQQVRHLPPLRQRAVPVPFGLGHPVWVEDPDFDLGRHLSRRRAPEPGGLHQLSEVVADVASRPLSRHRPLWEVVFVEGLADGGSAAVAKLHHAVADGGAAAALLDLAGHRTPESAQTPSTQTKPEALPSRRALLSVAAAAHRRRLRQLPHLVAGTVRGLLRSERRRHSLAVRPPLPLQAPRTSLNVSLDARRTVALVTLPLEELRAVRRATGTTFNDVYLAVCAGALRQYLLERGELPARPLVASVPLSTDSGDGHVAGNQVDNLYVSLATDIPRPLDRLRRLHEEAASAKAVRRAMGNELFEQRADVVPPQLYIPTVRLWSRSRLANRLRPPLNVIISNVAGPRVPLQFGPFEMQGLFSAGPILEGIGLNMTAWSYGDDLNVSMLGCPSSLPDPWQLADLLQASLTELVEACAGAGDIPRGDTPKGVSPAPAQPSWER